MTESNSNNDLSSVLDAALLASGRGKVLSVLRQLVDSHDNDRTLTIIANAGIHHLPEKYFRGEIYIASYGMLDLSTEESVKCEFRRILMSLASKLKETDWKRVYIVPFGPTSLSMQIKLLVFWICGIESVEVMLIPNGNRVDVDMQLREIILDADLVS